MAFTNNFRIERIYFEKLKSNIDILKSYIEAGATGEALELLKNSVNVDGAVLLLYRNLGEAWAELADLIQKTQKELKDLAEKTEAYHDELNERIDDVNNYLMMLIRELDARLQIVEQDLATMNRNKYYDLVENNGSYLIEKDGETVYFDDIKEDVDFPHNVILRYDSGTGTVELEVREFTDSRIDFYLIGLADSDKTVKEILVSIADTEAVTYSENTLENPLYTFGTGLSLDSNNELSVDFNTVQGKLTEGTGIDIDSNNEISVDTSVIQAKLTEGFGIDIDSNNEISVDTSVIQAKLSEGFGIDIDSNNEIKVDTTDIQEKLIAGQNITLTPDSTDPTKTVIDAAGGSGGSKFPYYSRKSTVVNNQSLDITHSYTPNPYIASPITKNGNITNLNDSHKAYDIDITFGGRSGTVSGATAGDLIIGEIAYIITFTFTKGNSTKEYTFDGLINMLGIVDGSGSLIITARHIHHYFDAHGLIDEGYTLSNIYYYRGVRAKGFIADTSASHISSVMTSCFVAANFFVYGYNE